MEDVLNIEAQTARGVTLDTNLKDSKSFIDKSNCL